MPRSCIAVGSALFAVLLAYPAIASDHVVPGAASILRVEEHAERATWVRSWDPRSPQRLVRIDGELYQQDAGLYFPVIPGRIAVRLAEGVKSWDDLVTRVNATAPQTFELLSLLDPVRSNRLGIVDLAVPPKTDLTEWCDLAHRTGLVRYAEVATYGLFVATADDPQYPNQWALNNTAQTGGSPGADVDAERAWEITSGDPSIVVAVLDSGTDIDHEDLAANVWHNDDEIPDNGVDDDSNGFIDDWEGWDFHNDNNEPRPSHWHGTHVTGVVNAVGGNGIGIASLAGGLGSPGVLGMALGVGDEVENGDVIDDGIIYAADNGAHVITMSLTTAETQAINDALDYAYHTKDVFIDCAAGNGGNAVTFPARHPAVMAVAATDNYDRQSSFSNPGPEVEVAAPGSNILSTQMNNSYGVSSGTSFAAPHVAATAALIRGHNPALTAADVRLLVIESVDDVAAPGFDEGTGHGRINAYGAVTLAATSDGIVRFLAEEFACGGTIDLFVADIDLAASGTLTVAVASDTEPGGEPVMLTESAAGSGLFRGSIPASYEAALPDGTLQMADGDTLVVEYIDQDDGLGGSNLVKSDTAVADCRVPLISELSLAGVLGDSATVLWSTDEDCTSRVSYGETVPTTAEASSASLVTDHRVDLAGLAECTVYYFSASSSDAAGNVALEDNSGSYFHFETLADFGQGLQPCHQGRISIDVNAVGCSSSVPVSLGDRDLNTDPGVAETVTVTVTSTTEPLPESLVLTETGPDTSTFAAVIPTASGTAVPGDGVLQVTHDDQVTATYRDEDDGSGDPRTSFDTVPADCVAPDHIQVSVVNITDRTAEIDWTTSKVTTGYVDWGTTPALGNQVSGDTLGTSHDVTIGEFDECGRVYFRVVSTDTRGYTGVADADGAPFEFNGSALQGIRFHDGFETETGWSLEGEWELGAPQGLGSSPGDPTAAAAGVKVLGHDLSGQGSYPGDYEVNTQQSAVSPVIDASSLLVAELRLQRWVNVANGGTAYLEVKDSGGTWHEIWNSGTMSSHIESSWSAHVYDVSTYAAGNPAFQIRFHQGGRLLYHHAGWNVDELVLRDASLPAFGGCGGCGGEPTFSGAASAIDDDPCAATGVTVAWPSAPAWGTGNGGTYVVYRDLQPGFAPSPANLVAAGLSETSWTDVTAPGGVTLYYLVRAENDETCATGPNNGGMVDQNLVFAATIDETGQPAPGDIGATLRVNPVNRAHLRLTWSPAPDAAGYRVYRSLSPAGGFLPIAWPDESLYEDLGAFGDGQTWYYRVRATDACGNEE